MQGSSCGIRQTGPDGKRAPPARFWHTLGLWPRPVGDAAYRGYMTLLSFDRYCSEIVAQTDLLTSAMAGADLTVPVPTCPGWTIGHLLRPLGGTQRHAEETVRTKATGQLPDQHFPDLSAYTREDPALLPAWRAGGAKGPGDSRRAGGPGAQVWPRVPGGTAAFSARRFTHETGIHRADATLAVGAEFTIDRRVAIDAIDEWMDLSSLPMHFEIHPWMRELLGPDRTLHFHATDTEPRAGAEWLVDLTGDAIAWRRAHEKAAVAVRGAVTDLLLIIHNRLPPDTDGIEILGDAKLLDFWLERVSFG